MVSVAKAFLLLETEEEIERFLFDILTPEEKKAIEMRWEIAKALFEDKEPYLKIAEQVKTSTTTVTRVNRFLKAEKSGYKLALDRIK